VYAVSEAQETQMMADTVALDMGHDKVVLVCRSNRLDERDPGFYMDIDWLAWVSREIELTTDLVTVIDERVNWMVGAKRW
jgi:hypothetical protein